MNPFLFVAIKLLIGFLAMTLIINITGKGNLAPSSASDQVVNYVLGGIVGGVIYNNSIKIYEFFPFWEYGVFLCSARNGLRIIM